MHNIDLNRCLAAVSVVVVLCWTSPAWAGRDARLKVKADRAAESGQTEFAYMHYRRLHRDYPQSPYVLDALFAQGEFHFHSADLKGSKNYFQSLVDQFPDANESIFALAYLYTIADQIGDQKFKEQISSQLIKQLRVSLIFRDHKELIYRSPLGAELKAEVFIDFIRFTEQGTSLATIHF